MNKKRAIIYARVSTAKQEYSRQISELTEFAAKNNLEVVKVFSEKVSGKTKMAQRAEAQELFDFIAANEIRIVLVTEVSRLGRSAIDVQTTVDQLVKAGINIYIKQQGIFILDEKGRYTTIAKIFVDLLANFAQMEREQISERVKSGMEEAKRKGKQIGRAKGSTKSDEQMLKDYPRVVRLLKEGQSIRNTATIAEVADKTVQAIRKILKNKEEL